MRKAKLAGCQLLHLSEGALSGYVKRQVRNWQQVDWGSVADEMESIQEFAALEESDVRDAGSGSRGYQLLLAELLGSCGNESG
jgi:predicted amidohydrolase